MTFPYVPELNELGEQAVSKVLHPHDDSIVITRGIVIAEILRSDDAYRGVIAVQIGRQGEMTPWDVLGLMAPVAAKAQMDMAERLEEL